VYKRQIDGDTIQVLTASQQLPRNTE